MCKSVSNSKVNLVVKSELQQWNAFAWMESNFTSHYFQSQKVVK